MPDTTSNRQHRLFQTETMHAADIGLLIGAWGDCL